MQYKSAEGCEVKSRHYQKATVGFLTKTCNPQGVGLGSTPYMYISVAP